MSRTRVRPIRRRFALGAAGLGLALAGCGVPTGQDSFSQIPTDEVPFRLNEQATTTTTTTSLPAPSTTPPVSQPDTPDSTEATTTTLPLETVAIYFLSRGELQPVPRELPQAYGIGQLAASLEAGPPEGAAGVGLDTLVAPGLILGSTPQAGVVIVELDEVVFDEIRASDQRPAVAQIVLTYTSNLRGVGQVSFSLDGQPIRVPKGDGLLSQPGEPLAFDDYANMLADRPLDVDVAPADELIPVDDQPTSTSTSTSAPTSTTTTPDG